MNGAILVTGAARGIGAACAELAAHAGHAVALLDRDAAALDERASALRAAGADALGLACDVRDEASVEEAFARASAQLGPLAGVIASAGIDRGGPLDLLDAATWDDVLAVNLRGTFLTCRAAVRHMLGRGGAIVCVSSPFARVAAPGVSAYSASKGGVSALVRALAVDYARHGIRANAVLPGPTDTELMWANAAPSEIPELRRAIGEEVPLGRLADAREPARAALWLLSGDASFVTGAELACDGGVLAKAVVTL